MTATDKHNTNTGATPYVCAPDICRGKTIKVWARARKGSTWSDWSYFPLIIQFKRPPIPPPGLATVETTPADPQMMIDLNTGMAALLKSSTGTYTFRLTPPGGQTFTDYLATLKINGVPSTAFSAHVSGGDYVITLVCTPQLCPPGTTFEFSVSGLSNAILSLPKIFALVTSTASGLPRRRVTLPRGVNLKELESRFRRI